MFSAIHPTLAAFSNKYNTLYRALGLVVFGMASTTQAATIGKTTIMTAQHEPLSASIYVTDIDNADNFKVSLAAPAVYQSMGLKHSSGLQVRFLPTSASSGQIILSSSTPISAPFTDVVLDINDNQKQQVIPKTLLMPIAKNTAANPVSTTVASVSKPNLPTTSPLKIQRGVPPQLSNQPAPYSSSDNTSSQPTAAAETASASAVSAPPSISSAATPSSANTLQQLDILNIQINRRIQSLSSAPAANIMTQSAIDLSSSPDTTAIMTKAATDTDHTKTAQDRLTATHTAEDAQTSGSQPTSSTTADTHVQATTQHYVVQRNDTLWNIAQVLADKNQLDISSVMQHIQDLNQDAFINGDANQIKASHQLQMPNYDVIPSQQAIETTIRNQRQSQRRLTAQQSQTAKSKTATQRSARSSKPATAKKPSQTAQQARLGKQTQTHKLPNAQVTLVAPTSSKSTAQQQQAYGDSSQATPPALLTNLRQSRQQVAQQATRVKGLNEQLSDYTSKLQLQNQKLAELEARLKQLRNQ